METCSQHPLLFLVFLLFHIIIPIIFTTCRASTLSTLRAYVADPDAIADDVIRTIENSTAHAVARGRYLGETKSCLTGNPIDDCWRCDPHWEKNRKRLADCAIGFGKLARGGADGEIYVVTTSEDSDDYRNPEPGTLRYAAMSKKPLWIIFARDMKFRLKRHILLESFKTIDGRGHHIEFDGGKCIAARFATNLIIHGLIIHNCEQRIMDGDGVQIFRGTHIWIDHNTLWNCSDGLIDVTFGSTAVTISNNHLTRHNKVMLLGHNDQFKLDKKMQVTIAFNHFGEGLIQRMPRCRNGYFHVVNNDYTHWGLYAIGGSAAPTINSRGNRFTAPDYRFHKEVTKRPFVKMSEWKHWNWRSVGDEFQNGAFFTPSGSKSYLGHYEKAWSTGTKPSRLVPLITANAGALKCNKNSHC